MGLFKPNVEKMKDKKDVKGLLKALKAYDWDIRIQAEKALGEIGEPAVEHLIKALRDKDRDVREAAARALGGIKDRRAVEPLSTALGDEWWTVRRDAAEALGKIGDVRAVEPLIEALKDEISMVCKVAARALKRFSTERTREAVEEYEEREREAAEERKREAKAKGRIKHLLILLEEEPVEEGLEGAVSSVLNNARYKTGRPYHNFVDSKTKIQVAVTGPEDYNEAYIFASARTHFPEIEAKKLRYNKFYRVDGQGRRSAGVVISD